MTDGQVADLVSRLDELENRVRAVEDTDAIRNLKAKYAGYCDDNYNPDKIAELFVEAATWKAGLWAVLKAGSPSASFSGEHLKSSHSPYITD